MNKNKGFIGLGIIIAIILGIIVVGGGAYYLGKSNSKQEVKVEENNNTGSNSHEVPTGPFLDETNYVAPTPINQNQPVVNNQQVNNTTSTTPSITVLSPNGGEVYKVGDKITVKWTSKGLSNNTPVQILLITKTGPWNSSPASNFDLSNNNSVLVSSGSATFTLPDINSNKWTGSKDIRTGNYYKIYISQSLSDTIDASDYSDSTFTINSETKNVNLSNFSSKYITPTNWPPTVQQNDTTYSCSTISRDVFDTPTTLKGIQKNINGRTFCLYSFSDSGAGHSAGVYTYITAGLNGSGTKRIDFRVDWGSCGVYGTTGDPQYDQCKNDQSNFFSNLDAYIANLM